jgi:hypothetical protein
MSGFPAEKPFNPPVSNVPVLGASSGNPKAYQDPNSVASVGRSLQARSDQAKADTLYDNKPEGFRNETYKPWILTTEACRKEGFIADYSSNSDYPILTYGIPMLALFGFTMILMSFSRKR